jgi:hypothetical protein
LLLRSSRTAAGQVSPVFPAWTATVYCTFDVHGLSNGTTINVLWRRAGRDVARNAFVVAQGTRTISTELASDDPLEPGSYDVEVRVGDRTEARTTFRIAGDERAQLEAIVETQISSIPRVFNLTLSTEECVAAPAPRSQAVTTFRQGIDAVHLCLEYENIGRGSQLVVRWFRGTTEGDPIATTTYRPSDSGELSALYAEDNGVPSGTYHVVITLDGNEVARTRFVVRP